MGTYKPLSNTFRTFESIDLDKTKSIIQFKKAKPIKYLGSEERLK